MIILYLVFFWFPKVEMIQLDERQHIVQIGKHVLGSFCSHLWTILKIGFNLHNPSPRIRPWILGEWQLQLQQKAMICIHQHDIKFCCHVFLAIAWNDVYFAFAEWHLEDLQKILRTLKLHAVTHSVVVGHHVPCLQQLMVSQRTTSFISKLIVLPETRFTPCRLWNYPVMNASCKSKPKCLQVQAVSFERES